MLYQALYNQLALNLNTTHVSVQSFLKNYQYEPYRHLNTTHVSVQYVFLKQLEQLEQYLNTTHVSVQ